ncbi:DUF87 domain-containing protein [Clostridia bacterium]|nr:DUF87 domain-containing protein [Clostridia bacterium]
MQDYEKLGVFYLGKEFDLRNDQLQDDMVLYKTKDLTTHAVIIGMTGSGKTGLGVSMIEEAALDNIPVIAIDPKGDLGNLALTFPKLEAKDFKPWINLQDASNKGMSADEYAAGQAKLWKEGLAKWGQDGARIEKFKNAADVKVYTPGGSAGVGVSVLKSFNAPPKSVRDDKDAFRDKIQITTTSILSLIGIDGDPFTSREHILLANLFEETWNKGENLGLAELIGLIQNPPIAKIGVMDLENFYPSKDRFSLAMQLNNLLASPSFEAWMEGDALDVNKFLYDDSGKSRVSVFSIAHLSDGERMFFVTMLLNEILSWVRSQPGTGSLRAILYMDEIFGYLPPTKNPPSKTPFLTLLKQARAYGLGLVLSTQNPVDLDYKALSNAGTWFIGRLQTERDKERVLAGLEGAAAGGEFDRKQTEQILAGLGKRKFYLHSVHENEPVIFNTRWVMSYLAGPLTGDQIRMLPSAKRQPAATTDEVRPVIEMAEEPSTDLTKASNLAPILSPQIKQLFIPKPNKEGASVYRPTVLGVAEVLYSHVKNKVEVERKITLQASLCEGPIPLDWEEATQLEIDVRDLLGEPEKETLFHSYPEAAANAKNYVKWEKLLKQNIRTEHKLQLMRSPSLKVLSEVDESEREFRIRLQHLAHEKRDQDIEKLKKKYTSKMNTLTDRERRARQALERHSTQSSQKKMEAAVSAGTAILGALFGRKTFSATSISKMGTAVKSTSRAFKSSSSIEQAKETLESVEQQLGALELELEEQVEKITAQYDLTQEELEPIEVAAKSTNITVHYVGLAWDPS